MVQRLQRLSPNADGFQSSANGRVRIGPLTELAQLVRDLGFDPKPVFASQRFDPDDFTDPDREISFVRASRLLSACTTATGCRHFGLLVGQRASPSYLGVPGYLLQTARDVRAAVADLVRHFDLHDRGAVVTLDIQEHLTYLGYAICLPEVEAPDQICDLAMAVVCNILRGLCGTQWNPSKVLFARTVPVDLGPYQSFFRAPLQFDADHSAVAFPSRWLDHRISNSDPILRRHLEKEAEGLHAQQPKDLVGELRGLLRQSMTAGTVDMPRIARQLGIHEKTLSRRLRHGGTSFRHELDFIRHRVAEELLQNTKMPLSKIAAALDYADTSAFIRAFKRWSGLPPAAWRRGHRHP